MEFTVQLTDAQSKVVIKENCRLHLSDYIKIDGKVMVISDDNIPTSLKEDIMNQIPHASLVEVAQGEISKSFETYQFLLEKLLELEFSRKDMIIALGGGVIGDLSGFVASTYKRGCRFISIPTTTLSQIDSSIGGKVAINMNGIKNCVGNFYHPEVVLIDIQTLKTLPSRHFYNGLVEALKAGCLADPILFQLFKEHASNIHSYLEEIITRSLLVKKKVVEEDEKEQHLRKILNFGHTIGHAIESIYHLSDYYHGECVANGMIYIEENEDIRNDLIQICKQMNIPFIHSLDEEKCLHFMKNDKKAKGEEIEVIQVEEIGKPIIKKIKLEELKTYLKRSLL